MHDGNSNVANVCFDWFIEEKDRTACAARLFDAIFRLSLANDDVFIFEVLTATRARSSKSFILCLCMITIGTKQVKAPRLFLYAT